jgi:hypothetical protein
MFGALDPEELEPSGDAERDEFAEFRSCKMKWGPTIPYWHANRAKFPVMERVAAAVLSAQATSVPSERLFSEAGELVSKRRTRLSDQNVNALVFCHENRHLMDSAKDREAFELASKLRGGSAETKAEKQV